MPDIENANTVYIAGKITGDPTYKVKFRNAARELTAAGFIVINPAVLPSSGFTYKSYMRMSRAMMMECAAVCFLPDWRDSDGAKNEMGLAAAADKTIFFYQEWRAGRIASQEAAQGGLQYAT